MSQYDYDQIQEIIADAACCLATKNAERITAENNGEDAECLLYEAFRLMDWIDVLTRYVPPGTIRSYIVDAQAIIDFSGFTGTLGDGMIIDIFYDDGATETLIVQVTGDFFGQTLAQFLAALALAINNSGTGFTALVVGLTIVITAPVSMGVNPIGSSIIITFPPFYILLHEEDNVNNNDLGFTAQTTSKPAYVDIAGMTDLLYVPNQDAATTSIMRRDFDGVVIGTPFTDTAGANWTILPDGFGLSTALYAVGRNFQLAIFAGGIDYRVICQISAPGYNAGTGDLTYTVTNILQNAVVTNPFTVPPGIQNWQMRFMPPGLGSVNLYNVDSNPASPNVGDLTLNALIITPIADPKDSYFHAGTNSVYILCCAVSEGSALDGVVRIDVAAPTVIAQVLNINLQAGQSMYYYPPLETFYINSSNTRISKTDTATPLGYGAGANIIGVLATDSWASMIAFTYNPLNGWIYYAPHISYPNRNMINVIVPDATITVQDQNGGSGTPTIPLITFTDSTLGVVGDGIYFEPSNNLLFVLRTDGTFQSYQVNGTGSGVISTTPTNYTLPFGSTANNVTFQSGANKLFISAIGTTRVYIFDPVTQTFDNSFVDQPNNVNIFSFTNDNGNLNYFGVGGGAAPQTLSVIHRTTLAEEFEGVFEGESTPVLSTAAENCLESPDIIISNIKKVCGCCDQDSTTTSEAVIQVLRGGVNLAVDANGNYIHIS